MALGITIMIMSPVGMMDNFVLLRQHLGRGGIEGRRYLYGRVRRGRGSRSIGVTASLGGWRSVQGRDLCKIPLLSNDRGRYGGGTSWTDHYYRMMEISTGTGSDQDTTAID